MGRSKDRSSRKGLLMYLFSSIRGGCKGRGWRGAETEAKGGRGEEFAFLFTSFSSLKMCLLGKRWQAGMRERERNVHGLSGLSCCSSLPLIS